MTVKQLREAIADAPDEAPITVVLSNLTGWAVMVTDGEVLDAAEWGDDTGKFLMLQIDRDLSDGR